MGWGDELIAAGQARRMQESDKRVVGVYDRTGTLREHEAWRNNPRILKRHDRPAGAQVLRNGPGQRPYISQKSDTRWSWKEFECTPGELYFDADEIAFASAHSPQVVVEPNIKGKASPNKDWGFSRWQELARLLALEGVRVHQLGPAGTRLLDGALHVETPTMRLACAVLARAECAALPEGGLHHAAAALGVRAAVVFGGFISPRQTGYASQTNFFTGGEPCGWRVACKHCAAAMARIEPAQVAAAVKKMLEERKENV